MAPAERKMMKLARRSWLSFWVVLSMSWGFLAPLQKGSKTALSIEQHVTFPATDNDNALVGFGWFRNGFALEDATTSCTFDSVFPLAGEINLSGGVLHLASDVLVGNTASIDSIGKLYGHNHHLDVSTSITVLSFTDGSTLDTVSIIARGDVLLSNTVYIQGEVVIDGSGNLITLADGASVHIEPGATLRLRNCMVKNIRGENVSCVSDSGHLVLENVALILADDYLFKRGSLHFSSHVDVVGTHTLFYESLQTSTVESHGRLTIGDGVCLRLVGSATSGNNPLLLEDSTACLWLKNCCLAIHGSGAGFASGKMIFDQKIMIDIGSTTTADGLIIGDGITSGLLCEFLPGARATFLGGHFTYNSPNRHSLYSHSNNTKIERLAGSVFYIKCDLTITDIAVESHNGTSLNIEDGAHLVYEKSSMIGDAWDFDFTGTVKSSFEDLFATLVLDENDSVFFSKGSFPLFVEVVGSGNKIHGTGSIAGGITLTSSADLGLNVQGFLQANVVLSGGEIKLLDDLLLVSGKQIIGPGVISLGANRLGLGSKTLSCTTPLYWDNGVVTLGGEVELSKTWTFSGNCVLRGKNTVLSIQSGGELVVDVGSSLQIENSIIEGVAGNNIRCVDSSATLTFVNSKITQSADVTFVHGGLDCKGKVVITGGKRFIYQSTRPVVIDARSRLKLDVDTTMSFDTTVQDGRALMMRDGTSFLQLNSATLHATSTLLIERGNLVAKGVSYLSNSGSSQEEGIIFGNGVDESCDVEVTVPPGAHLHSLSGYVVDNSVS